MPQVQNGERHAPTLINPNSAANVQSQIISVQADIASLANYISNLVTQLRSLSVKADPGPEPVKGEKESDADFNTRKSQWQTAKSEYNDFVSQVAQLNHDIEQAQKRIGEALLKLSQLQNVDLPAAQRRDTEEMKKQLEAMQQSLTSAITEAAGHTPDTNEVRRHIEKHTALRVEQKRVQFSDGSLKGVLQLAIVLLGQNDRDGNRATRMPRPPGGGLPPIGAL